MSRYSETYKEALRAIQSETQLLPIYHLSVLKALLGRLGPEFLLLGRREVHIRYKCKSDSPDLRSKDAAKVRPKLLLYPSAVGSCRARIVLEPHCDYHGPPRAP